MVETRRRLAQSRRRRILAGMGLLAGAPAAAWAAGEGSPSRFPTASVHFEQNATDRDVEVVFRVKGRAEGLARLRVVAPDGRAVIDFSAPDASTLGIREFEFESPEPRDVAGLKAAYPEGMYRFNGATASGKELVGESRLSHALPATASFLRPAAEARGVPAKGLEIAWTPPAEKVAGYIVEIEQDELGAHLEARLPGSATRFAVPDGFLRPGTEYDLGIGTVSEQGNVSFVETSFTTADQAPR
jgi:hypothetical protein